MAKFTTLPAEDVTVGRGRAAFMARAPYREAIADADAGKIELERGEKVTTVKRLLQDTAKELGVRLRSTYVEKENAILWKRVGA